MSDQLNDAATSRPHVPEWMAGAASDLLKNFARYQTGFAKAGLEMQAENFSFLQRRYEADAALAQSLMICRKPREVLRSCMEFFQHALDDYSQEAVRLTNIGALFVVHAADPPKSDNSVIELPSTDVQHGEMASDEKPAPVWPLAEAPFEKSGNVPPPAEHYN